MNNRLTLKEVITLVRDNPMDFISYFEALVIPNGNIILARPSHDESAIAYMCSVSNISRDDLSQLIPNNSSVIDYAITKYNILAVWYNVILPPKKITDKQLKTIETLVQEKIIGSF